MNELKADIRHLKELVRKADKLEQKIDEIKDNGFYMVDTDGNIDDYYFRKCNFAIMNEFDFYNIAIEAVKKRIRRRTDSLNKQDGTLIEMRAIDHLNWTTIGKCFGISRLKAMRQYSKVVKEYEDVK